MAKKSASHAFSAVAVQTGVNQAELALFTSPLIHVIWLAALWRVVKNEAFLGSDLIFPICMLLFVFYPLHPGFRIGPRYYYDFWPLAAVTIGAAIPLFQGVWKTVYRKALTVSIIQAGVLSLFLIFALRGITQSKFEMYERGKDKGLTNVVVCVHAQTNGGDVYRKLKGYNAPRNGIDLGDPAKAALLHAICVDCSKATLAQVEAVYPDRQLWEYTRAPGRHPDSLHPLQP